MFINTMICFNKNDLIFIINYKNKVMEEIKDVNPKDDTSKIKKQDIPSMIPHPMRRHSFFNIKTNRYELDPPTENALRRVQNYIDKRKEMVDQNIKSDL